jgi:hypothetical protein
MLPPPDFRLYRRLPRRVPSAQKEQAAAELSASFLACIVSEHDDTPAAAAQRFEQALAAFEFHFSEPYSRTARRYQSHISNKSASQQAKNLIAHGRISKAVSVLDRAINPPPPSLPMLDSPEKIWAAAQQACVLSSHVTAAQTLRDFFPLPPTCVSPPGPAASSSSKAQKPSSSSTSPTSTSGFISSPTLQLSDLTAILEKLPKLSSTGILDSSYELLSQLHFADESFAPALLDMYTSWLDHQQIPSFLLRDDVTPIPKRSGTSYRNIAVPPVLSSPASSLNFSLLTSESFLPVDRSRSCRKANSVLARREGRGPTGSSFYFFNY